MHGLTELVLENLAGIGIPPSLHYSAMLEHAVDVAPPPFAQRPFGRRYFELARDADWFAHSLLANAALEGYGAQQIWKFANRVDVREHTGAIRNHALDESRHSSMFVAMLHLVFPDAEIDEATTTSIENLQPRMTRRKHPPIEAPPQGMGLTGESLLDELVQVHITEIRALVLQFLLRSVLLAYSQERSRERLVSASNILIRDEARHIAYTAKIFEQAAEGGFRDLLFSIFETRLRGFNELTLLELSRDNITI